ncbi:Sorting nexin-41 [Wickerhamomyces ciferrii]|uniref:Sorting nexin-41 n=1 Tax=Wickerhamomyces ciferrii (strain ATCC 14091 / BCRC 22168 / CBS 111 / JCM 3599 / NBRC 0793 / NRRL Y-1031 F-60-10) TaxID=1206466 RepID=K0KBE1_WICCF|nr:Sorting nexin-41 [Wickerhamomyces ciferrii]CCH42330.1 Sorting nexin-41 [Wickerhamomyces ciferrii]
MDSFHDEDNNPFAGSDHLFASGIHHERDASLPPELQSSSLIFGDDQGFNAEENGFREEQVGEIQGEQGERVRSSSLQYSINEQDPVEQNEGDVDNGEGEVDNDISEESDDQVPGYYRSQFDSDEEDQEGINNQAGEFITITDAGHIRDMKGNKVIAYTINYNNELEVRRRYSEFDSLRASLVKLFPTIVIPPIPAKHSVVKYFLNPINAKNDLKIIEKRKRMLTHFLNGCLKIQEIKNSIVWIKFLDPKISWIEVLNSPPVSIIPTSNLLAPPLAPSKPSPLHLLLPIPQSGTINHFKPRDEDLENYQNFKEYEHLFKLYKSSTLPLSQIVKKQKRHFKGLVKDLGELGAYYNAFSLEDNHDLSQGIEVTGRAIDMNFINSEAFAFKILTSLEEPILEINQFANETLNVLNFRKLKEVQLFIIDTTIKRRKQRIDILQNAQEQANRLEEVLKKNAEQSPTIAAAIKRLEEGESINKISPWTRIFSGKTNKNDVSMMNESQRNLEIEKIQSEILKLNECLKIVVKDLYQVNNAIEKSTNSVLTYYNSKWKEIMIEYTESLLIWLQDNLKAWEDAKQEIEKIELTPPKFNNDDRVPPHLNR